MTHVCRLLSLTTVVVFGGACSGGRSASSPAPAEPVAAVRLFFAAVADSNLPAMAELWGGERGPAVGYMDVRRLEQRLTVIQTYLRHDSYEILQGTRPRVGATDRERVIEVRLSRNGCTPVVPITVVRYRAGWLVNQIDLEAAGNPVRRCR